MATHRVQARYLQQGEKKRKKERIQAKHSWPLHSLLYFSLHCRLTFSNHSYIYLFLLVSFLCKDDHWKRFRLNLQSQKKIKIKPSKSTSHRAMSRALLVFRARETFSCIPIVITITRCIHVHLDYARKSIFVIAAKHAAGITSKLSHATIVHMITSRRTTRTRALFALGVLNFASWQRRLVPTRPSNFVVIAHVVS